MTQRQANLEGPLQAETIHTSHHHHHLQQSQTLTLPSIKKSRKKLYNPLDTPSGLLFLLGFKIFVRSAYILFQKNTNNMKLLVLKHAPLPATLSTLKRAWHVAYQTFLMYTQYVHTHNDLFCIFVKAGFTIHTICFLSLNNIAWVLSVSIYRFIS